MRKLLLLFSLGAAAAAYAIEPSEFYDPQLRLDSIVNPGEIKTVYAFDQFGYETLKEVYSWSQDDSRWEGMFKFLNEYDAQGNETLYESYDWDYDLSCWTTSYKSLYEYENGMMVHSTSYDGEDNAWAPASNNYFAYDANGNTTSAEFQRWSDEANAWVPRSKFIYAYDDDNQVILGEDWEWDADAGQWVGGYKVAKEPSGVLKILISKTYAWDYAENDWTLATQDEGEWNDDKTCWTLTQYSVGAGQKDVMWTILYYFTNGTSASASVMVDNVAEPVGPQSTAEEMRAMIYDLAGRPMPQQQLRDLPRGIYIVNGKKVMR